jgi:hypothetical protein
VNLLVISGQVASLELSRINYARKDGKLVEAPTLAVPSHGKVPGAASSLEHHIIGEGPRDHDVADRDSLSKRRKQGDAWKLDSKDDLTVGERLEVSECEQQF